MGKVKTFHACGECGQQVARWVGRCPGCGSWGSVGEIRDEGRTAGFGGTVRLVDLSAHTEGEDRVPTGLPGIDRVLGGGLVRGSVALLAGEPGIGKSTLLLQVVAHLSDAGHGCLLVSGEESHAQVAARARRIGINNAAVKFAPGRDLQEVLEAAHAARPFLLAVDSIQSIREAGSGSMPGGPSQVRACTDALVGVAKSEGMAVMLTGHVTKDGDLAGPRTLEHAVDVVLTFEGDARSGLRVLSGGKNRFGAEGETAWFEMSPKGLREIDPTGLFVSTERRAGAATALPLNGRRALAVEVQALVGSSDGPARRQTTGLDPRRFSLVSAVLDRVAGIHVGRGEIFGAVSGGLRIDDPACDLAVAAALASAATGLAPPAGAAFVGEVALTGLVRSVPGMSQRLAAARAAGCRMVFAPAGTDPRDDIRVVPVRHLREGFDLAFQAVKSDRSLR